MKMLQVLSSVYYKHSSKYNCSGISKGISILNPSTLVEFIEMMFSPMFVRHNVKKYGNGKSLNCKY